MTQVRSENLRRNQEMESHRQSKLDDDFRGNIVMLQDSVIRLVDDNMIAAGCAFWAFASGKYDGHGGRSFSEVMRDAVIDQLKVRAIAARIADDDLDRAIEELDRSTDGFTDPGSIKSEKAMTIALQNMRAKAEGVQQRLKALLHDKKVV